MAILTQEERSELTTRLVSLLEEYNFIEKLQCFEQTVPDYMIMSERKRTLKFLIRNLRERLDGGGEETWQF